MLLYLPMACPYFYPLARLENHGWVIPPRVPLGDAYAGECRADAAVFQPDETHARQICNAGYGRGACDRFPKDASIDAVRFHIAQDSGELIRIQYVFEKDCWPVKDGVVEFAAASREIQGTDDAVLRGQAGAFVESYLRLRNCAAAS